MNLGLLHENDPAVKVLRKYREKAARASWLETMFARSFGAFTSFYEAGVEVDVHHWCGKEYITRVEYVGTKVEYNTVSLPVPRDLPPLPLYNGEWDFVPVWDHLGHTLAVQHIWEKEAEHEMAVLHCLQCDELVGKTMRRRIVES